jgi:hypothetical protein
MEDQITKFRPDKFPKVEIEELSQDLIDIWILMMIERIEGVGRRTGMVIGMIGVFFSCVS